METVFVLLMMTVGLSHGIDIHCDARQNGTQCYGAVNGTVSLRLVEKIETGYDCQLSEAKSTNNTILNVQVFEFKKKNFRPLVKYKNRSSFDDSSGTFNMSDVTMSDEAQYVFEIFDSGTVLQTKCLHLFVQAAVSPPKMSSECLSQGQRSVSCSCQGDSVQYSWTLDGKPLTDEQLFSGHLDTNNITLTQGLSGYLACNVINRVSSYMTVESYYINPCPGFKHIKCTLSNGTHIPLQWVSDNDTLCATATTPVTAPSEYTPHIAASLAVLLLLLVVAGGIYCSQKKKEKKKSTGADDEDVTYADVRLVQKADTSRREERQVEYGEVKGSKVGGSGGQHNADSTEDDSIYAKVRV